jgi:hypothetical protein
LTPKELHIICLNVPYPIDYGANFEQFYNLKALHAAGVAIHLHCYLYKDNVEQPVLNKYCKSLYYYQRTKQISFSLPYIISSRKNADLVKNLLKDNFPILMNGIHSSYLTLDHRFAKRKLLVRALNVEYLYYKGLAATAEWSLKKCYYLWEAYCLKKYEPKVAAKADMLTISPFDNNYFITEYKSRNSSYMPVFFESTFNIPIGSGNYCIYHGNLSVAENEEAVYWLIEKVFKLLTIPLVIAGKNPSKKLITYVNSYHHIHIVANPDKDEMSSLIADAHINVLPAINSTGVKLKIVTALYQSRFCITNAKGAMGIEDKDLLIVEDEAHKMKAQILTLMQMEFTTKLKEQRIESLQKHFSLAANAQKLIALMGFK